MEEKLYFKQHLKFVAIDRVIKTKDKLEYLFGLCLYLFDCMLYLYFYIAFVYLSKAY